MTLEQLRLFLAVAEREHVTAAARTLGVTQSAVSAAIAALEQRHGVRLFDRVGRGIVLSAAGHAFLPEARAVLAQAAAAEHALDDLSGLARGSLRVVASQTIAAYWLPPLLTAYRSRYPGIALDVGIDNTQAAAALVHAGEADLGFVEGMVDNPALEQWTVGEDRLVLVGHTPFGVASIDPDWLRRARWIVREAGSGTRSALDARLRGLGIDPSLLDIALVLPANESVRTAVESGAGIAALSALVVAPSLAAGTLHAAPMTFAARPFFALRHKDRYMSHAAQALSALLAGPTDAATRADRSA
ncbi:LysR family transcriptional regulator [Parablastomonas sp. CN1-191]|uniref:LysR family transcriptional regulator n=1 Tax=Parablastomonas sp. CN1-191 TaxID=3400908 RepID=UPI003BF8AC8C